MSCVCQTESGTRFVCYPDGSMKMLEPGDKGYHDCDTTSLSTSASLQKILSEVADSCKKSEKKPAAKSKRGTLYVPEATTPVSKPTVSTTPVSKPTVSTATKSFSEAVLGRPVGAGDNQKPRKFNERAKRLGEPHPALDIVIGGKVVGTAEIIDVPSLGNNCAFYALGKSTGDEKPAEEMRQVVADSVDHLEDECVFGKCSIDGVALHFAKGLTKNPDYAKLRAALKKYLSGSGYLDSNDIGYLQVYYGCCVVVGALYENKDGSHYIKIVVFEVLDENDGTAVLLVNNLKRNHWMYALVDGKSRSEKIYQLGMDHRNHRRA